MSVNLSDPPSAFRRRIFIAIAGAFASVAGVFAILLSLPDPDPCGSTAIGAEIGGPLHLTSHTGTQYESESTVIDGKPALVYFGYTYCPDICPLDVARISDVVYSLEEQGVSITPIFVSIDPERDTPEIMKDFIEPFHPDMIGLTGTDAQVAAAAANWRIYYARGEGDGKNYLMEHSTFTYLVNRDIELITQFSRSMSAEAMTEKTACHARMGHI